MTALPLAPPAGMRDLLHPQAEARAALGGELARLFQGHGYDLVVTPPFEHAEVLERGLAQLDRRDLLRFVEPESGEVALLRPDITPQIARVVATRLSHLPPPFRLRYQGTVIRRRRGRARKHRQIVQVGVEHIGEASATADVEIAALACRAAEAAGLSSYRLELRSVGLGGALLARVGEDAREDAERALAEKDSSELHRVLSRVELNAETRSALESLPHLYGDRSVLAEARAELPDAVAAQLDALEVLASGLDAAGVGDRLTVDLGETRGMAYYTGPSFVLLAEGPGEPIGGGGRYDELLGRFGTPLPATGFAMDLGNLEWATRGEEGSTRRIHARVVCYGGEDRGRVSALRDAGAQVAELEGHDREAALAFARAWGYDAALALDGEARALRIADGAERALGADDAEALLSWAAPVERG